MKLLLFILLILNMPCMVGLILTHTILQEPIKSHVPLLDLLFSNSLSALTLTEDFPAATCQVLTIPFPSTKWLILKLVDHTIQLAWALQEIRLMTAIVQAQQEALVLHVPNMFKVVRLYPEVGEIKAVERYMMGLVHQITPEDEPDLVLLHVMGEEGFVERVTRAAREGCGVIFTDTLPVVMIALGSGEPSDDGEDFTFENGGSK